MVHHNSESYLVVEVKSNKHLDPLLMEFKESILGKLNEAFSLGGGILRCQRRLYVPKLDELRNQILEEDNGYHYPFIRVRQRCIMNLGRCFGVKS